MVRFETLLNSPISPTKVFSINNTSISGQPYGQGWVQLGPPC